MTILGFTIALVDWNGKPTPGENGILINVEWIPINVGDRRRIGHLCLSLLANTLSFYKRRKNIKGLKKLIKKYDMMRMPIDRPS